MTSLNDLPTELVTEIVKFCTPITPTGVRDGKDDLCNLRLVSHYLDDLVTPTLFSTLHLTFKDADKYHQKLVPRDTLRCQEIIVALAHGTTKIYERTTNLTFVPKGLYLEKNKNQCIPNVRKTVQENLFAAVSALKGVQNVYWNHIANRDPIDVADTFIRALGTLNSTLQCLKSDIDLPRDIIYPINLGALSNLRELHISWSWQPRTEEDGFVSQIRDLLTRCPNLEEIYITGGIADRIKARYTRFRDLFAGLDKTEKSTSFSTLKMCILPLKRISMLRVQISPEDFRSNLHHFRKLEFLDFPNDICNPDITMGQICNILKESRIWLKGLVVDFVSDPLIWDYLMSFSGMEHLILQGKHSNDNDPLLVNRVYRELLPQHKATLTHLGLGNKRFHVWSTTPSNDQLREVVKCRELKWLHVYWRTDEETLGRGDGSTISCWLKTGIQLPKLEQLYIDSNFDLDMGSTHWRMKRTVALHEKAVARFKAEHEVKFRIN